jgi:hypothetical protein
LASASAALIPFDILISALVRKKVKPGTGLEWAVDNLCLRR